MHNTCAASTASRPTKCITQPHEKRGTRRTWQEHGKTGYEEDRGDRAPRIHMQATPYHPFSAFHFEFSHLTSSLLHFLVLIFSECARLVISVFTRARYRPRQSEHHPMHRHARMHIWVPWREKSRRRASDAQLRHTPVLKTKKQNKAHMKEDECRA